MPQELSEQKIRQSIPTLKELVEERKEKAIESLSTSYAKNRLPLEEYERLVEYINKIESERELIVVEKMVAEYGGSEKPVEPAAVYEDEDELSLFGYNHSSGSTLAILSTRIISGPLKSGSQFVNILGSYRIKIRKEDLSKRHNVLSVATILGDCVIYVESGIRVINRTFPILGSSEIDKKVNREAREGGPELVISGAVLLGDIKVKLLTE